MHNELLLDDTKPVVKSCTNCEHRRAVGDHCERTGWYCSTEMKHGGQCNKDGDLVLWTPRLGVLPRLKRFLFG